MLKEQVTSVDIPKLSLYFDTSLCRNAILARPWKYVPTKYRLLLYDASIKPLFTYCCTIWSNCSQTNLDEQFKLQKCCARLILDSPRDAWSFDNFQKLKWLPIDQIFKLNKIGLLKKVIDGRAPENLTTTLDSLRFKHKYSTRTKTFYCLLKPRTEAMRRTFFYSSIKELNTLNLEPMQPPPLTWWRLHWLIMPPQII